MDKNEVILSLHRRVSLRTPLVEAIEKYIENDERYSSIADFVTESVRIRLNELGQILSVGGELPVAREISKGAVGLVLFSFIRRSFPNLPESQYGDLISVAERAVSGGGLLLEGLSLSDVLPLERLSLQPLLPDYLLSGGQAIVELQASIRDVARNATR